MIWKGFCQNFIRIISNFLNTKNVYVFTSALSAENSSFKSSSLIVPTLYNIGKFSFKNPVMYYNIGRENTFDVETQLQQVNIITLVNNNNNIIPKQQYFNNKVVVKTSETPFLAAIYNIKNKNEAIKNVSYN